MANYTSTHTGATIDASVTIVSGSGVTQSDLTKLNAVTSSAVELNLLDGVTASTIEINILDGLTASTTELNYLDGIDSSITTLSLPDNTTITTFGASLIDDADAASARTTLGVDVAGTDNSTDVTLVTTSHDYLSISGQAITLGSIDISDDTNLVGGTGITLTGDTLSTTDSEIVHDNLSGFVADEHIDHSSVSITAGTGLSGGGDLTSTRTLTIDTSVVTLGGTQTLTNKSIDGNSNTITNVDIVDDTINTLTIARGGTGGTSAAAARSNLNVDVAGTDNSTDVTLVTTSHDYLSISGQEVTLGQVDISDDTNLVGGTGITLTGDTLSITDSEIVHDNLSGFVANEHIDHSGVSITAGAGLTGGGDITATRDIAVGAGTGVTVNADDIAIGQDVATNADVTFNTVTADIIGDIRGATKFQAKADVALNKGDAVYISGISGNTPTVDIADANDSAKMPSFGLAASSVSINASVEIITFGTLSGMNTSAFSVGDILYISTNGTSGNTLTATPPTGETSLIQNIGKVQRSHASAGSIKVGGAGRSNATPNLNDGNIFIGNGSNQAVSASLNTKIEDYLDGGTSTANFDTISVDGAEITATPAELNVLDGITSTTAELNYTDGVTSNIQTQLDAKAPLASPAFTGTATGANLTLSGDLTVNGSTTTLDTTNLAVEDNLMELNAGVTSNANDSGFLIERGTTGDNAIFMWDESADKFTLGTTTATGTTTGDITLSSTGTLVANVEGDVTGAVTGNADTATTLATARNFSLTGDVTAGAVSFDGSGNVALATTIAANSVALGTDTTGNYMSDLTEGTGIDISHTPAEGSNGTITLDLTEVGFGGGANRLITDDGDGTVSTESGFTIDGTTLLIGDSKVLGIGNGTDLELKHDTNQNYIDLNLGNLTFRDELDNNVFRIKKDGGIALLEGDAQIPATSKLYLDGTAGQTYITESQNDVMDFYVGSVHMLRMEESGTDYVTAPDNIRLSVGTGKDLQIYHNGSNNYIDSTTSDQDLYIRVNDGGVTTTAILIDASNVGQVKLPNDNQYLSIGASGDLYFFHDGTNSVIRNATGDLVLRNDEADQDIILQTDDGSGGIATYLTLNGSAGHLNLTPPNNVGIGTNNPEVDLHIVDDTYSQLRVETSGAGNVEIETQANDNSDEAFFGTRSNHDLKFRTNWTNAMTIDTSQNVGIGTSSPAYKLQVSGGDIGIDVGERLYFGGGNHTYISEDIDDRLRFFVGGAEMFRLNEINDFASFFTDVAMASGDKLYLDGGGNTYIFEESADNVIHYVGGQNKLRFNSTGTILNDAGLALDFRVEGDTDPNLFFVDGSTDRVGIGTNSPSQKLHIAGQTLSTNGYKTNNGSVEGFFTADTDNANFGTITSGKGLKLFTANTEKMRIDSSGNVGIGTTSPGSKLHIRNDSAADQLRLGRVDDDSYLSVGAGANYAVYNMVTGGTIAHQFQEDGDAKMTIQTNGNVGIGLSGPRAKLEIGGSNDTTNMIIGAPTHLVGGGSLSEHNSLLFDNTNVSGTSGQVLLRQYANSHNDSEGALAILTTSTGGTTAEAMRIRGSGNVGIGTTSPSAKLEVNGDLEISPAEPTITLNRGNGSYSWRIVNGAGTGSYPLSTFNIANNAGTPVITALDSGNVGIGTTSPDTYNIQLASGYKIGVDTSSGGTTRIAEIEFYNTSDGSLRLKTDNASTGGIEFHTEGNKRVEIDKSGDVLPGADGTQDLGASSKRWGVIYSADLDLSNEGSENDVDGTWGSYVIQEGEDDLFLINRRSGKKYKFMLQEVQD